MIISCTFSKPVKNIEKILDRPYLRIKAQAANNSNKTMYYIEKFTKTQAFHEQKTEEELDEFIRAHAGTTFKNCVLRTDSEEITYLGNKKGNVTRLSKKLKQENAPANKNIVWKNGSRQKKLPYSRRNSRAVHGLARPYDKRRKNHQLQARQVPANQPVH
ncbi:MAG: hypothetical protein L6V86_10700 [Treponema sp.]|nr:MAG: hypothetical protein L6V86_10700 [Treponema sp.]